MNQPPHCLASALAICVLSIACSAAPAADPETIPSIWKPVDVQFSYLGMTTFYSCDALEAKLAQVLRVIGAHDKTEVSATGCEFSGPSRHAFVRIKGGMPAPATAENLKAVTDNPSRQALLKRLGVKPELDQDEFAGVRKAMDLSRVPAVRLQPGDCELIDQLAREVLPKLGVTIEDGQARCFPGQIPISTPSLRIVALMKVTTH